MSLSLSTFSRLLFLGLAAPLGLHAQSKPPGRAIELSEPASNELLTNFNRLAAKQNGRKQLEDDLLRPQRLFSPNDSLGGIIAPPFSLPAPGPAVRSTRVQELLERRKNWIFMSPEDLTSAPSAEELLKLPEYDRDGQVKKKLSPLERYYQNLDRGRNPATTKNKFQDDDVFGLRNRNASRDAAGSRDDANSFGDGKEKEGTVKGVFDADSDRNGLVPSRGGFSDVFGLANVKPLVDHDDRQKARMREFNQLLGLPPSLPATGPAPGNPLGQLNDPAPQPALQPGAGLYGKSSSSGPGGFGQPPGAFNPLAIPGVNSGANPNAFGQFSFSPALPKVEQPRATPPQPAFTAPKRPF